MQIPTLDAASVDLELVFLQSFGHTQIGCSLMASLYAAIEKSVAVSREGIQSTNTEKYQWLLPCAYSLILLPVG